jgi:hypothetical protein
LRPIGGGRHALGADVTSGLPLRACECCRSAHAPCVFMLSFSCVVLGAEKRSCVVFVGWCCRSCVVSSSAKHALLSKGR